MEGERLNNQEWLNRALKVIPSGSQTYSKSYKYYMKPFFADYGINGYLYDVEGNEYHDFNMALGAVILGYKNIRQEFGGTSFSWPHPLEVELAEKLVELIPSAEMVKFFKNGSDATEIAVRLARAYTGKDIVLTGGYHGFHDWYVLSIERSKGVLSDYVICGWEELIEGTQQFKTIVELEALFYEYKNNIACVIVEPDMKDICAIAELTRKNKALLIFDEVLTGFRYHVKGLQYLIGITPDISCFGKCMANGLPLSAVVGRRDIMMQMDDGGVFASSTFGGDTLAFSAAIETIKQLEIDKDKLWTIGTIWKISVEKLIKDKQLEDIAKVEGFPPRCGIVFNDIEYKSLYQQELLKRKIIVNGLNNFCLAHTEEQIEYYIKCCDEVLDILVKAKKENNVKGYLENGTIQNIFKR